MRQKSLGTSDLAQSRDEFHEPRSDIARQEALATTTITEKINACNIEITSRRPMHLKSVEDQCLPVGVVVEKRMVLAQVSSSALDRRAAVAQWLRYPTTWQACHEFDPSTTKDPPCRAAMHVKSVES
ncbi:hypothetical protein TNCV_3315331 [Trichonephila clavipes]|nr:hypothetical protein TNCV_3315331 [Trichonephila clavipes]